MFLRFITMIRQDNWRVDATYIGVTKYKNVPCNDFNFYTYFKCMMKVKVFFYMQNKATWFKKEKKTYFHS